MLTAGDGAGSARRLRIAQVAPLAVAVPPSGYGGTERVVHCLTEGLVRRGHEVTLFAAGGSRTSARLRVSSPRPLWELPVDPEPYAILQAHEVVQLSNEFDVVHSHTDFRLWLCGERLRAPLVTTLHGRLDLPWLPELLRAFPDQGLVSISDAQRRPLSDLPARWLGTVYNGLGLEDTYRLGGGAGGYLAFVGRIGPEKDPPLAIRVALRAGLPLKIAARVDPVDRAYHEREVVPLLRHRGVEWLGELDDRAKAELLAGATALLMPVEWEEPFGLSFIEALAAGTPVISRPRGSLPELVVHGRHGFLVETEDELVEAVRRVGEIDRRECREWALGRFSSERMVAGYERVYRSLVRERRGAVAAAAGR